MIPPVALVCLIAIATLCPGPPPAEAAALPSAPTDPRESLLLAAAGAGLDPRTIARLATPRPAPAELATAYAHLLAELRLDPHPLPPPWHVLPDDLQPPLLTLVNGVTDAVRLQNEASADLTPSDLDRLRRLANAYVESRATRDRAPLAEAWRHDPALPHNLDRARIAAAAYRLLDAGLTAAPDLRTAAAGLSEAQRLTTFGASCLLDSPGLIALCGPEPNTITGDHILRVDLGGDDHHAGNNAASGLLALWPTTNGLPAALLLDLDGHDTYDGQTQNQGAGATTPGVLLDLGGHDTYRATASFFTFAQGAGNLGGVGILHDAIGDDQYLGAPERDDWDTQGFGILSGIGILHDTAGADLYHAGTMTQGVGDFQAVGLLIDNEGADHHDAVRYAQAFADGGGLGMLWDASGPDTYYASQGRVQGAAIGGTALLLDTEGDDEYWSDANEAQGWAIDGDAWIGVNPVLELLGLDLIGAALLIDGAGQDIYSGPGCDSCVWTGGSGGLGSDTL